VFQVVNCFTKFFKVKYIFKILLRMFLSELKQEHIKEIVFPLRCNVPSKKQNSLWLD